MTMSDLLRPGSTCWRFEHARRIALLVDGAAYFPAMKAAMEKARHSILLLGWDFDPRVPSSRISRVQRNPIGYVTSSGASSRSAPASMFTS